MSAHKMRHRNCKILATLGPVSDPPERLKALWLAGADAFRLNFSHGSHEDHARRIKTIRAVEREVGRPIAIVADLQGPKIRVGQFEGDGIDLRIGKKIALENTRDKGNAQLIPIPHPELFAVLEAGDILKLDDGRIHLKVLAAKGDKAEAEILIPGKLTDRKGVNIPDRTIPVSALTDKDREDLAFVLEHGVDFIALSFVQRAEDVLEAQKLIDGRARIIVKIEKPAALNELDKIIEFTNAVMVARGDLGVELSLEQVPVVQRHIISKSRAMGRPVIVATQMLESMITAPSPTRAEASDVATAVYQGTDAVMLSAESAVGRHSEASVAIMDRIIQAVEEDPEHWANLWQEKSAPEPKIQDAIALSVRNIADLLDCQAVLAFTDSGSTAVRVSRERPHCKVLSLTPRAQTARQMSLVWGVHSVVTDDIASLEEMEKKAVEVARAEANIVGKDPIIVTAGIPFGRPGTTNFLKIINFDDEES